MSPQVENEILQRLARIEEKLDSASSHEDRLRRLERWQAALYGIVAFAVFELQLLGGLVALKRL